MDDPKDLPGPENIENIKAAERRDYWRMVSTFLLLLLAGLAVLLALRLYDANQREQRVRDLAETLKQEQAADYAAAIADTYGGKTPQETLQMYIDAVEKGDYELASRYFIGGNQQKELDSLKNSKREDILNVLSILKNLRIDDLKLAFEKEYDSNLQNYPNQTETKEEFVSRMMALYGREASMSTKVDGYDFNVRFRLYPNNYWKIIEF